MYAERLMAELGWLDDAGNRMGMLDAQRFRAARVVIDIGVHCGHDRAGRRRMGCRTGRGCSCSRTARWPRRTCASSWTATSAGPGQAPSYAVGQRIWQQLRDEMLGRGLSLKEFHRRALDLGGLPLDVLRSALIADFAAS